MKTTGCFGCPFFDSQEETGAFWCVSNPSQIDDKPFCSSREEYIEVLDDCPEHWVRTCLRTSCNIPANVSTEGMTQDTIISNISESGLFVESDLSRIPQRHLQMTFTLPGADDLLRLEGDIIRSASNGLGVRFVKPDKKEIELINSYIKSLEQIEEISH